MKRETRNFISHCTILVLALGALAVLAPATASAQPPACTNAKGGIAPGRVLDNLGLALRGQPTECDWASLVRVSFPNSMGSGSYNIPVLAAAIALVVDPVRSGSWDMYAWWDKYLRGELGLRGDEWTYGGRELGSSVYQQYNIASVLAVHYQTWRTSRTALRNLARQWLRATFAIHALAAVPSLPSSFHDQGQIDPVTSNYTGPWVALPGMRSTAASWPRTARSILFARAVGLGHNLVGEPSDQRSVRTWIEPRWNGPGGNVYGLSSSDQQHLRNVTQQAFVSNRITGMLNGIHTVERLHLVRWGGVRVSLLERNRNNNTAPTFGIASFPTGEAHMLYPWIRTKHRKGITSGAARLDLAGRSISADNFPPTSAVHGPISVTVSGLPAGAPAYHIVLGP